MKQILKSFAVLALAALAASCAKEQATAPSEGETEVSFTLAAPVLQTRAIADGNTVDKVACNVYDKDGNLLKGTEETPISKVVDMTGGNATFSVRLVTGQEYSFIFWAYKASEDGTEGWQSPYTLSADGKTVTVSYEGAKSNDEKRDAFYAYVEPFKITGAITKPVELKRPFAQLNFGVEKDDIKAAEAAGIVVDKSKVTLTGLGNELNLVDGSVTGEVDATFKFALCPTENLTVDNKAYGYVAMNYVLVGKDAQTLTDAKLKIRDASNNQINNDGLTVTNVPLQGNYRTNVLGNLFTSAVNFNIVVDKEFETPDNIVKFVEVADIASANEVIKQYAATDDVVKVKFAAAPGDNSSQAILTTPIKESGTLNIEISENVTGTLYVGDYTKAEYTTASTDLSVDNTNAKKATVNITIPDNVTITTLVINAPSKTVTINGVKAESGTTSTTDITTLEVTASPNTLVIEEGQTIGKLILNQGGLEIHGTVNDVEIKGTTENVFVRDCENLSDAVYQKLKGYIATSDGYAGVQNADNSWDITIPVMMDGVAYTSLQGAIDAASTESTERVWITLYADIVTDKQIVATTGKNIGIDFNWHTITYTGNVSPAILADGGNIFMYLYYDGQGHKNIVTNDTTIYQMESKNGGSVITN